MVTSSRGDGYCPLRNRIRTSNGRTVKELYNAQRPSHVPSEVWGDVFDGFIAAWAQSALGDWLASQREVAA
jgi:hypothetical protein